jgi:hypothetical protein
MKLRALALFAATTLFAGPFTANAVEDPLQLIDYEIEDQFNAMHERADVDGRVVLLIGSDKDGSEFNALWGKAINDALIDVSQSDQIIQLPQADLRGVPFFVKGMVKEKFPQEPEKWVMMDWKGVMAKAYDFVPGFTNLLVFSSTGALQYQSAVQQIDEDELKDLVATLQAALAQ